MYMILCRAIDSVIEPLELLADAEPEVRCLRRALLAAEEVYIVTSQDDD